MYKSIFRRSGSDWDDLVQLFGTDILNPLDGSSMLSKSTPVAAYAGWAVGRNAEAEVARAAAVALPRKLRREPSIDLCCFCCWSVTTDGVGDIWPENPCTDDMPVAARNKVAEEALMVA